MTGVRPTSAVPGFGVAELRDLLGTPFSDEQVAAVRSCADRIPVLIAANTSLGLAGLMRFLPALVRALGVDYDLEIIETHHRHKADAPSGTALAIGNALAAARDQSLAELRELVVLRRRQTPERRQRERDERQTGVSGKRGERRLQPGELAAHRLREAPGERRELALPHLRPPVEEQPEHERLGGERLARGGGERRRQRGEERGAPGEVGRRQVETVFRQKVVGAGLELAHLSEALLDLRLDVVQRLAVHVERGLLLLHPAKRVFGHVLANLDGSLQLLAQPLDVAQRFADVGFDLGKAGSVPQNLVARLLLLRGEGILRPAAGTAPELRPIARDVQALLRELTKRVTQGQQVA
mgnify:CR=1 FL=1